MFSWSVAFLSIARFRIVFAILFISVSMSVLGVVSLGCCVSGLVVVVGVVVVLVVGVSVFLFLLVTAIVFIFTSLLLSFDSFWILQLYTCLLI